MSVSRQHLPPAVESPSPLAGIGPALAGEDFGSNDLQQQLLLAQVVTTDGVRGPRPTGPAAPRPQEPRPRPGPIGPRRA